MTVSKAFVKARPIRNFCRDKSGLALIEFALTLPIFMGLGFYGTEVANLAITQMKVSQIALNMADNASRIGTLDSTFGTKAVLESQINDIFQAADLQAGRFNVYGQGRAVVSSLEMNQDGGQTIVWQRCKGYKGDASAYGEQGDGEKGKSFMGMGPAANRIAASPGTAVMFVELYYEYEPLFGEMFMKTKTLRQEAAFIVRDKRELGTEPTKDTSEPRTSTCEKFDDTLPQSPDANPEDKDKCSKRIHKDHYHWECPEGTEKPKETKNEKEANECALKLIVCVNGVKVGKNDDDD